ncbi:MAG: hypothetical protein K2M95_07905 [Clostridiales bacterium]|nr:hypothetical protein [Clostridiales bacterium]
MVTLLFSKECGFCFGVQNAVKIAENAQNAYTYGEIIHNEYVTEKLRKRGVTAIDSLENLRQGDTLILRSHGVSKATYEKAKIRA